MTYQGPPSPLDKQPLDLPPFPTIPPYICRTVLTCTIADDMPIPPIATLDIPTSLSLLPQSNVLTCSPPACSINYPWYTKFICFPFSPMLTCTIADVMSIPPGLRHKQLLDLPPFPKHPVPAMRESAHLHHCRRHVDTPQPAPLLLSAHEVVPVVHTCHVQLGQVRQYEAPWFQERPPVQERQGQGSDRRSAAAATAVCEKQESIPSLIVIHTSATPSYQPSDLNSLHRNLTL